MKCPNCGLDNPSTAQRCDCGYSFPGQPDASGAPPAASKAKRSPAGWAVGVVGIVLGISGLLETWHVWNKPSFPPPPSAPVYRSWQSAKYGIRLKVLQDWKIEDGDQMMAFTGPAGINVRLQVGATPDSLEDFTRKNLASIRGIHQFASDIDLLSMAEPQPAELAGSPAYNVEYAIRVKGTPARGWQIWTVKDHKAYIFTFSAGPDSYPSYLPIARTMAGSLEAP